MIYKEYKELLAIGDKEFVKIVNKLNEISFEHIRDDGNYRRDEDYKEICIALALIKKINERNINI